MSSISVEVDTVVHAAYIRLSENPVHRTVQFNDETMIDLDEMNVAVGIELLDEGAALPFTELVEKYHVHTDVVDLLRLIRPDVASFLEFTHANEGSTDLRPSHRLHDATA